MVEQPAKIRETFQVINGWVGTTPEISRQQIVVAIPAFNEERFIGSVVIQALRCASKVIVIDDGSSDGTAYIAESAGAKVLKHPTNLGKSQAVNTALEWARFNRMDILVLIDGDGQHRPDEISQVINPVLSGEADLVVGSRFLSVKSRIPYYRKVGQNVLTVTTNLASGVRVSDSQSGFRAFSRRAIELLHFNGTGLSVESEMQFLAREHSLIIAEVPITVIYNERAKRNPFRHGLQIISNITSLVGQARPLFFFGVPGLSMVFLGLILGLMTLDAYHRSQIVPISSALASLLLLILGVLSTFVGLILHSIRAFFLDLKRTIQLPAQSFYNKSGE